MEKMNRIKMLDMKRMLEETRKEMDEEREKRKVMERVVEELKKCNGGGYSYCVECGLVEKESSKVIVECSGKNRSEECKRWLCLDCCRKEEGYCRECFKKVLHGRMIARMEESEEGSEESSEEKQQVKEN